MPTWTGEEPRWCVCAAGTVWAFGSAIMGAGMTDAKNAAQIQNTPNSHIRGYDYPLVVIHLVAVEQIDGVSRAGISI